MVPVHNHGNGNNPSLHLINVRLLPDEKSRLQVVSKHCDLQLNKLQLLIIDELLINSKYVNVENIKLLATPHSRTNACVRLPVHKFRAIDSLADSLNTSRPRLLRGAYMQAMENLGWLLGEDWESKTYADINKTNMTSYLYQSIRKKLQTLPEIATNNNNK